jgi:hypothetical protein
MLGSIERSSAFPQLGRGYFRMMTKGRLSADV